MLDHQRRYWHRVTSCARGTRSSTVAPAKYTGPPRLIGIHPRRPIYAVSSSRHIAPQMYYLLSDPGPTFVAAMTGTGT